MLPVTLYLSKLNKAGSSSKPAYLSRDKETTFSSAGLDTFVNKICRWHKHRVVLEFIFLTITGLCKRGASRGCGGHIFALRSLTALLQFTFSMGTIHWIYILTEKNKERIFMHMPPFGWFSPHISQGGNQIWFFLFKEALSFNSWLACKKVDLVFCSN